MSGENCSNCGCTTSRSDVAIFGLPQDDDAYNVDWRRKLIHIITKDRLIDKSLRAQIEKKCMCVN